MRPIRAWLDETPLAALALGALRDATGRADPLEVVRPDKAVSLPPGRRVAFWSLVAGVGTSTVAALTAHRSAGAGRAPLLADLDRWAPSLALRAGIQGATIADALLRPGRERECLSRWSKVAFLPGAPHLAAMFDGPRVIELIESAAAGSPAILDLGAGADALEPAILAAVDRLCLVAGPRAGQLQAAFRAVDLLTGAACPVALVIVGADESDAQRIARRLPWPHIATIPADGYLASDEIRARAPTMTAVDRLIAALA